jgi:hypothetical protein
MTRHTRLVHLDLVNQLVDGSLAVPDCVEDPPPSRFGDHLEDVERSGHDGHYTPNHIYVQAYVGKVRGPMMPFGEPSGESNAQ